MNGLLPQPDWDNEGGRIYRCRKAPYSKVEAQTVLNSRLRSRHGRPECLRIYHCEDCNAWHLSSKEDYHNGDSS